MVYTTFERKVRMMLAYCGMTQEEMAKAMGISVEAVRMRFLHNRMTWSAKAEFAKAFDAVFLIYFETEKGEKIYGNSLDEIITEACQRCGETKTSMAMKYGLSRQAFSSRCKVGKFSDEELEKLAKQLNCKYVGYFLTKNGSEI